MSCARACGVGSVLTPKKRLEAEGREEGDFILLSPSLVISVVEVLFFFFFLVPGAEPATCA